MGADRTSRFGARRACAGMFAAAVWLAAAPWLPATARAQQSEVLIAPQIAERFATVAAPVRAPRGIAADPERGEVFVSTFVPGGRNFLLRFDADGRLLAQLEVGATPRFGLAFNPRDRKLYMASGGALIGAPSTIQRVPADFGPQTAVEDVAVVPDLPAPPPRTEMGMDGRMHSIVFQDGAPAPNCLDFRPSDGTLFFTDSFQAAIFQIDDPASSANVCPGASSCVKTLVQNGLLASSQPGGIGADGIALGADQRTLFVANAGDDRILAIDAASPAPQPRVLNEGIPFPDGIILGPAGTLIVVAFQGDRLVVLDAASGARRAELGSFLGVQDGAVVGIGAPAQAARIGDSVFVTNFGPRRGVTVPTLARVRLPAALLGADNAAP